MYENKTEHVILNNMLDKVTSNVAKTEGTLIYDALSPVACEAAKHYNELDAYIKRGFVQTSWGRFLDLRAAEHGLYRKDSTNAIVDLTFTGTDGLIIPKGTPVETVDGKRFTTDDAATIANGTVVINATADTASPDYNLSANTITIMATDIAGVTGVTNATEARGGGYGEDDISFKNRILYAVRNPGSSGNVADYYRWASEVDGVGLVRINPLAGGAGNVGVVILDTNRQAATPELIAKVAAHIEGVRPIGATVTVITGGDYKIDLHVHVILDGTKTLAEVTDAITKSYADYLQEITFVQTSVYYQRICTMVFNTPGVKDIFGLTLYGPEEPSPRDTNISFHNYSVPRVGTIDVVEFIG